MYQKVSTVTVECSMWCDVACITLAASTTISANTLLVVFDRVAKSEIYQKIHG